MRADISCPRPSVEVDGGLTEVWKETRRWQNRIDAATSRAISAEFVGTLVFTFLANASSSALGVAFSYAVASYLTAPISSGHLNPAITISQAFSGYTNFPTAGLYVVAQLLGSIVGALFEGWLLHGVHIGHNHHVSPPGCFPLHTANWFNAIVWEAGLTYLLLATIYATSVGRRGQWSVVTPIAAAFALYVGIEAGGAYTGAIVNPARLIGPAIVFFCGWKRIWFNLIGELLGAAFAAGWAYSNYGAGPHFSENRGELEEQTGGLSERLVPGDNA